MKHVIIDQPHLQSAQQKLGSKLLALTSWLLWLYFLLPLFTLGGWLLGVKSLSDEIRWFGGYKTLLELLGMYCAIIVAIGLAWLLWSFFLSWLHASIRPQPHTQVSDADLSARFRVADAELKQARQAELVTVHFNEYAEIARLECQKAAANRTQVT
ncbi:MULTISPECIES: poly-beta-1,6-N-acetyl-D-glucosamine biosynthesis protein PgaD [Methylomonas]|uniref:poly-beta-1,6-N-acetyl-D-glucosamine biosynthesis protein PgaD n=1 Tax=Methylomonas TaxID=416 RepID=UPI001231D6A9|nr:poly-beta-1,6-N-acetyl-D-glucosamine biosynthesis protein PgaD [Methylomonas rhizoryzae]